jgi:hypothetical protein
MLRHRSLLASGLLACLTIAACSTPTHSAGHGALSPNGSAIGSSTPAGTGSPTAVVPTGAATGTTSTTGPTSATVAPVKITTTVQPVSTSNEETTACPYTFTVTATVAVSRGPITVTYDWKNSGGVTSAPRALSFNGSGPQQETIRIQQVLSGNTVTGGETLEIVGHSATAVGPDSATYRLTCDPYAETPIANPSSGNSCPYSAEFSTNIHTFGPGDVTYEWYFSDGTTSSGDVNFTGQGASQSTVFTFHAVPFTVALKRFGAYLAITSGQGFTTASVHPSCFLKKAP